MKKNYFVLAAAALAMVACNGLGLNQEEKENEESQIVINPVVEQPEVKAMDMTGYEMAADQDQTTAKETMSMAAQTSNNLFREVMANVNGNFGAKKVAARRVAAGMIPYDYNAETDVLTVDYGTTPVEGLAGFTCAGKLEIYNAKFALVETGVITVQTKGFTIDGMTFIGQMEIQTKALVDGLPNKVAIKVANAYIKNGMNMISFKGTMGAELASGLILRNVDAEVACLFGKFTIKSVKNLVFADLALPVEGEIAVKMQHPVSYTYDGKAYTVDNFSIGFAKDTKDMVFGFEYKRKGFSATYAELAKDYPSILATIGIYLAVLVG